MICYCICLELNVFIYDDYICFFFFKQKTAYEMRISDWSSDVCSSDLPAGPMAPRETGLMCANMLRAFQVGKALTSDGGPSSWMRPSPVAWDQVSWPACHLTKASASAVT